MRPRLARVPFVLAALAPASLVLVHDLSFLAEFGARYRQALIATGHDARWTSTVEIVVVVSALLAIVGVARLGYLWRRVHRIERTDGRDVPTDVRGFVQALLRLWPCLALLTAVLFMTQENLERASLGEPLPGLGPLLAASPVPPLAIVAAVTFLISLVGALLVWGHASLIARIAAALTGRRRARVRSAPSPVAEVTRTAVALIALNLGRRAPPLALI
jgi:hypothetical protein